MEESKKERKKERKAKLFFGIHTTKPKSRFGFFFLFFSFLKSRYEKFQPDLKIYIASERKENKRPGLVKVIKCCDI